MRRNDRVFPNCGADLEISYAGSQKGGGAVSVSYILVRDFVRKPRDTAKKMPLPNIYAWVNFRTKGSNRENLHAKSPPFTVDFPARNYGNEPIQ